MHGTFGCSAAKPNNTPVTTRITYSCIQMRYARGGALGQLSCHAVFALCEVFLWKRCFSHEWVTVFKKRVSGESSAICFSLEIRLDLSNALFQPQKSLNLLNLLEYLNITIQQHNTTLVEFRATPKTFNENLVFNFVLLAWSRICPFVKRLFYLILSDSRP